MKEISKMNENTEDSNIKWSAQVVFKAFNEAKRKLVPAWDVQDYVAVNPFFGMKDTPFMNAIKYMQASTGASLLPKPSFYRAHYENGDIQNKDISFAIQQLQLRQPTETPLQIDHEQALKALYEEDIEISLKIKCISDIYDQQNSSNVTNLITREVSKWLAAYFDEGQAVWSMPNKHMRLFYAWQKVAQYDSSFKKYNLNIKDIIARLPVDPEDAIEELSKKIQNELQLDSEQWTNYLFRLLCSVNGWASYVQRFEFEAERDNNKSKIKKFGGLIDLIAIRMSYDYFLLEKVSHKSNISDALKTPLDYVQEVDLNYLWLLAYERAYRKKLLDQIKPSALKKNHNRPTAQLAFCIDVRSEVIRRHIEQNTKGVETIGFAGFFGVPIAMKGLAHQHAEQQCPILLEPQIEVSEIAGSAVNLDDKKKKAASNYKMHKKVQASGNSCFSFVETMWWSYMYKMLMCCAGKLTPDLLTNSLGLSKKDKTQVIPDLAKIPLDKKVSLGVGALTNMGLIKDFASFVVFFGHEAESANNPQSGALDCGACAGHSGLSNAKVLAGILNDPEVRAKLTLDHAIAIPDDTLFLAGVHNTTIDSLTIEDCSLLNDKQTIELANLKKDLNTSATLTQKERAQKLSFYSEKSKSNIADELHRKANDWSEVRPEWGLAGNASFIVARRERTEGVNLWGRSFLHNYNHEQDQDLSILELIMTAPMVVTNWINMQYYASTIDPKLFGCGNKVLHNVVGTLGVLEGNEGDLRVGLSEQSVRYNGQYVHEPIRLQVVIETTPEKVQKVIDKHKVVSDLVRNQWVNLITIDPETDQMSLFESDGWLKL